MAFAVASPMLGPTTLVPIRARQIMLREDPSVRSDSPRSRCDVGGYVASLKVRGCTLGGSVAISSVERRVESRPTMGPGLKVGYCFAGVT
jgi:hypothetical protein